MSPFEFVTAINETKQDLMAVDGAEKSYNSFIVNRALSYFPDTILFANEMNRYSHIPSRAKFEFFINSIRKRKRFSKWAKSSLSEDLEIVKEYYGYNNEKARSALTVLSTQQIQELKSKLFKGGHNTASKQRDRTADRGSVDSGHDAGGNAKRT